MGAAGWAGMVVAIGTVAPDWVESVPLCAVEVRLVAVGVASAGTRSGKLGILGIFWVLIEQARLERTRTRISIKGIITFVFIGSTSFSTSKYLFTNYSQAKSQSINRIRPGIAII